jgi:hypothetical protein
VIGMVMRVDHIAYRHAQLLLDEVADLDRFSESPVYRSPPPSWDRSPPPQ